MKAETEAAKERMRLQAEAEKMKYTTLFHHKYDMVVEKQAKTSNK